MYRSYKSGKNDAHVNVIQYLIYFFAVTSNVLLELLYALVGN